jgi:hypothetical protein
MGFLRNFGKIALGSLFSISLALLLIVHSFSQLTEYSNLKKVFSEILLETRGKEMNVSEAYYLIKTACKVEEKINLPINNDTLELNCSELKEVEEKDFLDFVTTKIFEKFYFKEYPYDLVEYLKKGDTQNFLAIFSKSGNLFFKKIQNYLVFVTAVLCIGFILVLENWQQRAKGLGKVLLSTGLLYFILKFGYSFFLPTKMREFEFIEEIFNNFSQNFLYVFIIGVSLTIFGYLLGHFKRKKAK